MYTRYYTKCFTKRKHDSTHDELRCPPYDKFSTREFGFYSKELKLPLTEGTVSCEKTTGETTS